MVNPWEELVQTTIKVILHIFSEFQRDFRGTTRVSIVNSWVELYQSTPKAILHIYAELATLLLSGKSHWNLVDMLSVTLEVVYTNSTHEFTPVFRVHSRNLVGKSP